MIQGLVNIARLKQWEFKPTSRTYNYSVTLNPNTKLLNARFAIDNTLKQLKGLNVHFNFTVYGGKKEILYEYKC